MRTKTPHDWQPLPCRLAAPSWLIKLRGAWDAAEAANDVELWVKRREGFSAILKDEFNDVSQNMDPQGKCNSAHLRFVLSTYLRTKI